MTLITAFLHENYAIAACDSHKGIIRKHDQYRYKFTTIDNNLLLLSGLGVCPNGEILNLIKSNVAAHHPNPKTLA